jgi:hypothetical protein
MVFVKEVPHLLFPEFSVGVEGKRIHIKRGKPTEARSSTLLLLNDCTCLRHGIFSIVSHHQQFSNLKRMNSSLICWFYMIQRLITLITLRILNIIKLYGIVLYMYVYINMRVGTFIP